MAALKDFLVEKDYIACKKGVYTFEQYNCSNEMLRCNGQFIDIENDTESLIQLETIYDKLTLLYDDVYAKESLSDREIDIFHDIRSAILIPMGLESDDLKERELTDYELSEGIGVESEAFVENTSLETRKAVRRAAVRKKKAIKEGNKQRELEETRAAFSKPTSQTDTTVTKPEEAKKEETKPEEAKKKEGNPEEAKSKEGKPEDTKKEDTKPEDIKKEDTKSASKDVGFFRKLWNTIQRIIAKIADKISGWYVTIFQSAEKLITKAKAMLTDVDKLKEGKPSKSKLNFTMKHLIAKGETFAVGDSKPVSNLKTELKTFVADKTQVDLANKFISSVKSMDVNEGNIDTINDQMLESVKQYFELSKTKSGGTVPNVMKSGMGEEMTAVKLGELPGNKSLYSFYSTNEKSLSMSRYKLGPNVGGQDADEAMDVDVKSPADIKKMIENVISLAEITNNYKKNYDAVKKVKKELIDTGKKFSSDLKEDTDLSSEAKSNLSTLLKGFKMYTNMLDTPANELNNINIRYCYSLLSLSGAMIKAYGD